MSVADPGTRAPLRHLLRRPGIGLAAGGSLLMFAVLVGGGRETAAAYLAAWGCLLALPVGALPVVVVIERVDAWRPQPETALLETLRGLLGLMPVAALLLMPVLATLPALYPWAGGEEPTRLPAWFNVPFFLLRLVGYFAVWIWLASVFVRRVPARRMGAGRRAMLGLGLHLTVATLAAGDIVMALSGRLPSILAGLVIMAHWSSLALAAAILAAPPDVGPARRRLDRLKPLAVLLAVWACLHVAQFLASSTTLPDIAQWYAIRGGLAGRAFAAGAGLVVVLAALLALRPGEYRARLVAALALVVHIVEAYWFVTPEPRGTFRLLAVDGLALAGIAALALALAGPVGRTPGALRDAVSPER